MKIFQKIILFGVLFNILQVTLFCAHLNVDYHILSLLKRTQESASVRELKKDNEEWQTMVNNDLCLMFGITPAEWVKVKNFIEEKKANLAIPRTKYAHFIDTEVGYIIPKWMIKKIYALLEQYDIEPTAINIFGDRSQKGISQGLSSDADDEYIGLYTHLDVALNLLRNHYIPSITVNQNLMASLSDAEFENEVVYIIGQLLDAGMLWNAVVADFLIPIKLNQTNTRMHEEQETTLRNWKDAIRSISSDNALYLVLEHQKKTKKKVKRTHTPQRLRKIRKRK